MHVLMLPSWYKTPDKPWRGTYVRDQALALQEAGVRTGIAFVERRSLSKLNLGSVIASHFQTVGREDDGVPTVRMRGWSTFAQTIPGSLLWARLTRHVVRAYVKMHGVPDVIHGHAALFGGYAAMQCARELGRPYVVTEHSSAVMTQSLSPRALSYAQAVYRNAAKVVAVSHALASGVDAVAGRGVAAVIPNAVDSEYFHLPFSPRRPARFTFLAVCDLVDYTRLDVLIRAFSRLRWRNPRARLVIIGAGKEEMPLRRLAEAVQGRRHVQFLGALPRWHVRQWMWDANALVLPSSHETFGVVLIEALSTGLPVIATRCGGPGEIVTPDLGTLVPPGDEDALMNAMEESTTRRVDAAELRASVRRRFDYPVIAEKLRELYEGAAASRRKVA